MTIVLCGTLEYLTSYFMEKIFKARWWDYSKRKFNLNGRVCLGTLVPFGIFGMLLMYVTNPFFLGKIQQLPQMWLDILFWAFLVIYHRQYCFRRSNWIYKKDRKEIYSGSRQYRRNDGKGKSCVRNKITIA